MLTSMGDRFELANGVAVPCLGIGTWQVPNDAALDSALSSAIQLGYRHFDTAQIYGNMSAIGRAIHDSGIAREEFFVTSKVWTTHRSYEGAHEAFEEMLEQLKTDYLDLLLVHWPAAQGEPMVWQAQNAGTWRAFEELYKSGRVRSIGVSNFLSHHLVPLLARAKIAPMVNQLEIHPGYPQLSAIHFCFQRGIVVQAWSPLGRGGLSKNQLLIDIGEKYGKSAVQVALRWCLQHGIQPITKSMSMMHQKENLNIFDFELSEKDMQSLDDMPLTAYSGLHPDTVAF